MRTPHKPFVFVTLDGPDDGGDFGPHTPGTRTSGIQEAVDYAQAHCRDVYIWGGRGGLHKGEGISGNVYTLDETLHIPWSQDFTVEGGNYLLAYRGASGHAIHIDSQMNCRYKFGLITSGAPEAVVCIRPETPGPDDFTVVTASVFDFSAIVSGHPQGTSLMLDSSAGLIVNSRIFAEETNSTGTGVYITDAGGRGQWISNNHIQIIYGNQYHAGERCTGLRLGDPGSTKILHNTLSLSFHAPRGAYFDTQARAYVARDDFLPERAVGADLFAQRNSLTLTFYGKRAPGHDIVFEPEARDNTVFAMTLPNGITNLAAVPTNRVIPRWPAGFDVETPAVPPSGQTVVNRTSFTVQAMILHPGRVSAWTITDAGSTAQFMPYNVSLVDNLTRPPRPVTPPRPPASQTIPAGLTAGQTFLLEPGEQVSFIYAEAPAWRWKAVR
jgi:hypothetical protein